MVGSLSVRALWQAWTYLHQRCRIPQPASSGPLGAHGHPSRRPTTGPGGPARRERTSIVQLYQTPSRVAGFSPSDVLVSINPINRHLLLELSRLGIQGQDLVGVAGVGDPIATEKKTTIRHWANNQRKRVDAVRRLQARKVRCTPPLRWLDRGSGLLPRSNAVHDREGCHAPFRGVSARGSGPCGVSPATSAP